MNAEFYWVAVVLTTIVSASRLTRLATFDEFPPVRWLRNKYAEATDGGGWQLLAFCAYCAGFWVTGAVVVWGLLAGVYDPVSGNQYDRVPFTLWWAINGIFAMSYLAAILMIHDGDNDD